MKKKFKRCIAVVAVICICSFATVASGDNLYNVMNFEDAKNGSENFQDAVIIAEITQIGESSAKASVIEVASGEFSKDEIIFSESFSYYNVYSIKPKTGDIFAAAVKLTDSATGTVKANMPPCLISPDTLTDGRLRFYISHDNANILEIKSLEIFINSKGETRSFSYDDKNGILTVHAENGDYVVDDALIQAENPLYEESGETHDTIQSVKLEEYESEELAASDDLLDLKDFGSKKTIAFWICILAAIAVLLIIVTVIRHKMNIKKKKAK